MKTTIVYAHPRDGSFNNAVLKEAEKAAGDYELIDLYADEFNPVMSKAELAVYARGEFLDPLVAKYNQILDDTARIVFIFPIFKGQIGTAGNRCCRYPRCKMRPGND